MRSASLLRHARALGCVNRFRQRLRLQFPPTLPSPRKAGGRVASLTLPPALRGEGRVRGNGSPETVGAPLAFCGLISLLCLLSGCGRTVKPTEPPPPPAPVKWEIPRQTFLEEWTELVGTTQPLPDHAARVTAPVGGVVVSLLPARSAGDKTPIVEGQMVQKGEVLAQMDATAIRANLAKAQAAKNVLKAEREVLDYAVQQAALELKRLQDLERQKDAKTPNQLQLVSPVMLDKARLALQSAQASLRADDRKLDAADKEEAALELEIGLYTLKAPRKGRLGRLQVVIGQTLAAGAPVVELVDIEDEIDVLCFVSPSEARKLQLGQPAHIGGLDKTAISEMTVDPEGKVVYIADQAEAESGLFAVKLRFPNTQLKLRASSVARVRIQTKPDKFCCVVPESALLEDQDPPSIVVVEEVEVKKNAEGKEEQVGKARRLRAVIGMRDRLKQYVEIVRLDDPDEKDPKKKWHGDLEETNIIIEKGQSLQTGDAVKLDEEEEEQ